MSEQFKNAEPQVDLLLQSENPVEQAELFDGLNYKQAKIAERNFLLKLISSPQQSKGFDWLIRAAHCLTGPLKDLPQGVTSLDARGVFRSSKAELFFTSPGQEGIPPRSADVEQLMKAFSTKVDKLDKDIRSLNQIEKQNFRLSLAIWSATMLQMIHPFWDGNARSSKTLFCYLLGNERAINIFEGIDFSVKHNREIGGSIMSLISELRNSYLLGLLLDMPAQYYERLRELILEQIDYAELKKSGDTTFFASGYCGGTYLDDLFKLEAEFNRRLAR